MECMQIIRRFFDNFVADGGISAGESKSDLASAPLHRAGLQACPLDMASIGGTSTASQLQEATPDPPSRLAYTHSGRRVQFQPFKRRHP